MQAGVGVQHPLVLVELGQGLACEGDLAVGVAAELSQERAPDRDRRGNVRDQAGGPADRWLVGLIGRACVAGPDGARTVEMAARRGRMA
jgi:hypothetical protein